MEFIYFAIVAVVLYVVADRILDRIEVTMGRRLEYRTLIFLFLLLGLALISFAIIRWFGGT